MKYIKHEEKAKEIYQSYLQLIPAGFTIRYKEKAKQASLLCVRNIIDSIPLLDGTALESMRRTYWIAVRFEIEKL